MRLILLVIPILSGCWTPPDLPMETITHTDVQGNYIGNIDPEDWAVHDFKQSDLLEMEILTIDAGSPCIHGFLENLTFRETSEKPVIKAYPNPVHMGETVFIDILYAKKITRTLTEYMGIFGCNSDAIIVDSTADSYTARLRYTAMPGHYDMEYKVAFIAADSSSFITKGDIKIIQ